MTRTRNALPMPPAERGRPADVLAYIDTVRQAWSDAHRRGWDARRERGNVATPPEVVAQMRTLYVREKQTITQIGQTLGYRPNSVYTILVNNGVSMRPHGWTNHRHRALRAGEVDRTIALYLSGKSLADVGREIGRSPESVRQRLLGAGVAMRERGRNGKTRSTERAREIARKGWETRRAKARATPIPPTPRRASSSRRSRRASA